MFYVHTEKRDIIERADLKKEALGELEGTRNKTVDKILDYLVILEEP